jgi:penicillin-binding protein 1C
LTPWRRRAVPVLAGALLFTAAGAAWAEVPGFEAVRTAHQPSDRLLLDRHGQALQVLRIDAQVRRGDWVTLDAISPAMRQAIVLSEDRRFWAHAGIDWRALAASAWANAWNERTRGASTLTMQLAGLLHEDLSRPAGGRSLGSKITQVWVAQRLEARWRKAQILEAYLNLVPLRGELVGVGAAAWQLFGKHPAGLDAEEAALLAVLVRGPNATPAVVERRACALLQQQAMGCDALPIVWSQALARRPGPAAGEQLAPHFARWWLGRQLPPAKAAQPWRSTVDARLQRLARQALRQQLAELKGRNVEDGAVLVLDRASGEVLAWVGSAGSGSAAPAVDAVLARRQGGSTLKPFVYGAALQQRLVTAASVLDDSPLQIATGGALYRPRNYDEGHQGPVTLRRALAGSLNIPAVRVAQMLGPEEVFATLQRAGLQPSEHAGYHGHALALGAADLRLLDLTEAYRRIATGALFGQQVGWLLADMLADPAARAGTFGLDSPLVTRGWAAVKTGTSKDMRDNWCVGFSDHYVVGVWVGNTSGAPMHAVSGTEGAAPVWREVLMGLHAREPSRAPAPTPGLVRQGNEWFLPGTLPRLEATAPSGKAAAARGSPAAWHSAPFGIRQPRDGAVFVLDPDIPAAAQQVLLEGAAGRWLVNGREVGRGTRLTWLPRPGQHVLERQDAGGRRVDRVRFEVRPGVPIMGPVR